MKLQSKLHDTARDTKDILLSTSGACTISFCGRDTSKRRRVSRVVAWIAEVSPVERIEHFPPELNSVTFLEREVLRDSQIANVCLIAA